MSENSLATPHPSCHFGCFFNPIEREIPIDLFGFSEDEAVVAVHPVGGVGVGLEARDGEFLDDDRAPHAADRHLGWPESMPKPAGEVYSVWLMRSCLQSD